MKFKLQSDEARRITINMAVINAYASRYKPHTVFEFEIVRRRRTRSDPMRKYFFGAVLPPFMRTLGYEPEETEIFYRQLKIVHFRVKPDGRGIYREKDIPSVFGDNSVLDINDKKQFLEWVVRKAAENGCYIADPGE